MHELSLAEDMLEMIQQRAVADHFSKVSHVWLEVGALSHVEAEAMRFCFDAVTEGSLAQGAELHIQRTEGQGRCLQCQHVHAIEQLYDPCPRCGQFGVDILQGDQVRIQSLEVC